MLIRSNSSSKHLEYLKIVPLCYSKIQEKKKNLQFMHTDFNALINIQKAEHGKVDGAQ